MLTLALALALSAPAAPALTQRYGGDCIGDRCVVRDRHGRRIATVTREPTGRLAVRDRTGRLRAKITPNRYGGGYVRTRP